MKAIIVQSGLMHDSELGEVEISDTWAPGSIVNIPGFSWPFFVISVSNDRRIPEIGVVPRAMWGFLSDSAQEKIMEWEAKHEI